MGRSARIHDAGLGAALRRTMAARGLSAVDVAAMAGVSRATVHRALQDDRFSFGFGATVTTITTVGSPKGPVNELLRKSLHLLRLSDRMRQEAETLIILALDQSDRIE